MKEVFYEYKGKPYKIFAETKTKIDGAWVDSIVYQALYHNPDGQIWVRTRKEFFKLFKRISPMRVIQSRLLEENPQFRRLWVQYSHHRNYRVVITLFPQGNAPYEMAFGQPQDLSYESINEILQNYLQNRN